MTKFIVSATLATLASGALFAAKSSVSPLPDNDYIAKFISGNYSSTPPVMTWACWDSATSK